MTRITDICSHMGDPIRGRKVKVIRPINAVTENQPYLWNWKVYKHQTWCTRTDGVAVPTCAVPNLKAPGGCSCDHLHIHIVAALLQATQLGSACLD